MATTPLAGAILDRLALTYPAAADPAKAGGMRTYMRDQFDFLGLRSTEQRAWPARCWPRYPSRTRMTCARWRCIAGRCRTGSTSTSPRIVRKAIGWALREYARTAPDAVRGYVRAHGSRLSGLSVREALKNL